MAVIARRDATHYIVLTTNYGPQKDTNEAWWKMREKLKRWSAQVNSRLYGRRWSRSLDKQIFFVAFAEKMATNPHFNLMAKIEPRHHAAIEDIARDRWLKLVPSGDLWIVDTETANDNEWTSLYSSKEIANRVPQVAVSGSAYERFIISTEFSTKYETKQQYRHSQKTKRSG